MNSEHNDLSIIINYIRKYPKTDERWKTVEKMFNQEIDIQLVDSDKIMFYSNASWYHTVQDDSIIVSTKNPEIRLLNSMYWTHIVFWLIFELNNLYNIKLFNENYEKVLNNEMTSLEYGNEQQKIECGDTYNYTYDLLSSGVKDGYYDEYILNEFTKTVANNPEIVQKEHLEWSVNSIDKIKL